MTSSRDRDFFQSVASNVYEACVASKTTTFDYPEYAGLATSLSARLSLEHVDALQKACTALGQNAQMTSTQFCAYARDAYAEITPPPRPRPPPR